MLKAYKHFLLTSLCVIIYLNMFAQQMANTGGHNNTAGNSLVPVFILSNKGDNILNNNKWVPYDISFRLKALYGDYVNIQQLYLIQTPKKSEKKYFADLSTPSSILSAMNFMFNDEMYMPDTLNSKEFYVLPILKIVSWIKYRHPNFDKNEVNKELKKTIAKWGFSYSETTSKEGTKIVTYSPIKANRKVRKSFHKFTVLKNKDDYEIKKDSTGKWVLTIGLRSLKPNSFYDVVMIRRPYGRELDDYWELFGYLYKSKHEADTPASTDCGVIGSTGFGNKNMFLNKVAQLNKIKHPSTFSYDTQTKTYPALENFYTTNSLDNIYKKGVIPDCANKGDTCCITRAKKELFELIKLTPNNSTNFSVIESFKTSTTMFNFETRARQRILPDFGFVFAYSEKRPLQFVPYIGAQIKLRYNDKNIPYRFLSLGNNLYSRLSLSIGISLTSLNLTGKREDLFPGVNKSMMFGAGFTVFNGIKVSGGTFLYNRLDPNPLINKKRIGALPYFGISIDLDIRDILSEMFKLTPWAKP